MEQASLVRIPSLEEEEEEVDLTTAVAQYESAG
jgi:hypothetical protein